ncbi:MULTISPECIES: putative ABC transporter permease [Anaerostipes]|uniref:putative ABC transporter permease n=1 Tax=Anaerostipes TaxID=207244 RepID=UPI000953377A|nr:MULTISPECIES: hypothetical protein [Anaerostipes]MCI5623765.1 hypothetical protein [Anaerostipes sp.]OLR58866.1 hypothetical protein BHF70_04070 [Anaerostipes sp. 494a]
MSVYYVVLSFFVYGFLGWCTEVAFAAVKERYFVNRGFLNGPICPIYGLGVTAVVFFLTRYRENLLLLYIASVVLVTVLEGLTGWLMEKIFHARWWDYSEMPLNIGGYVCLLFSLIWGVACVLIVDFIHPVTMKLLSWIPYYAGCAALVLFMIGMFADLYVTVASILKMNKRLAAMQEIAQELHRISDEIGENIYENVKDAMDHHNEIKQKSKELSDGMEQKRKEITDEFEQRKKKMKAERDQRRQELIDRYHEISEMIQQNNQRLLKAFPRIHAKRNQEILNYIKNRMSKK